MPTKTLLVRFSEHPEDPTVWDEFVDRYGKQLLTWCRHYLRNDEDASDVAQGVLIKIAWAARAGKYDPTRSEARLWIRVITRNACIDYYRARARGKETLVPPEFLNSREAHDDLIHRYEQEDEREKLALLKATVIGILGPDKWEIFEAVKSGLQQQKEVALERGLSEAKISRWVNEVSAFLKRERKRNGWE